MKNVMPRVSAVSLSKIEVAVVRNLLLREGATNQTILGQINAKRRHEGRPETNGGRISEVRNNHERYEGITPATDDEVQEFFSGNKITHSLNNVTPSPIGENQLRQLFPLRSRSSDRLNITETNQIECKASFSNLVNNCLTAIVAFANNRGGYLVFGVEDGTWKIIGINAEKFREFDRALLANALHDCLSSEVKFEMTTLPFGSKSIGILYIHKARTRPVIYTSTKNNIAKGQIYYRYDAANRPIGPTELQEIINERVTEQSQTLLGKHIDNILSNGIENSAILNLATGEVDGKAGNFTLDRSILSQVSFVKEGEFVDKSGAPTLTITGDVKEITVSSVDQYPFSYRALYEQVKRQVPKIKQFELNNIIRENDIKKDRVYSYCMYTSPQKQKQFDKNGTVSAGAVYIYNQAAIDFLISQSKILYPEI